MIIDSNVHRYLTGTEFSEGAKFDLDSMRNPVLSRLETLVELGRGKSVLHVGCCDHIQYIKDKLDRGLWLHKLISDSSSECLGVDIDSKAINFVKNELGYKNVVCGNLLTDSISEVSSKMWNFAILGEILEHVDDPIIFLRTLKEKYGNKIERLVITVPNAFSYRNIINLTKRTEIINTDHRYWFSPFTLAKVVTRSGWKPKEIFYADPYRERVRPLKYLGLRRVKKEWPSYYSDTLIVICES